MSQRHQHSTEFTRRIYVIQPYAVGTKGARSLALIIPARIARQCDITTDTMFSVKADTRTKAVTLQTVNLMTTEEEDENENKKAGAVEVSDLTATPL
jgi:hypothetical protein